MLSISYTATPDGVSTRPVEVEVDLARGLPAFTLVGLPDSAAREGRERIRAAIVNQGYEFPARRISVNLAPAALPKRGCAFDLPVAAGVLVASEQLRARALEGWGLWGELAFDGRLRAQPGALAVALGLAEHPAVTRLLVPAGCGPLAAQAAGLEVFEARDLGEAAAILEAPDAHRPVAPGALTRRPAHDWEGVRGAGFLLEALVLAAAGGHGLLLLGPPGAGKSYLGTRLVDLLPDLPPGAALEVAAIHEAAGLREPGAGVDLRPPLRCPGPGASKQALTGGGRPLRPGAVTLAHRGVLMIDEATELPRGVLDSLRGPLVDGAVQVSRSHGSARFPAAFQLVLAANPCPCGWHGVDDARCACGPAELRRYDGRLSGPLLDRVDVQLVVAPGALDPDAPPARLGELRARVARARARQAARFGPGETNATQPLARLLDATPRSVTAGLRGLTSPRAQRKLLGLAWTHADLAGRERPGLADLEAAGRLRFRPARGAAA